MPRTPKGKVGVYIYVDEKIWQEFRDLVRQKHDEMYGLSIEVEEALRNWLRMHTQMHTKTLVPNKVNPTPKVHQVYRQIKEYLRQKYGFVYQQVPRRDIVEAISAIRGSDPRTIKKWFKQLLQYRLIKNIAGEVFEIV